MKPKKPKPIDVWITDEVDSQLLISKAPVRTSNPTQEQLLETRNYVNVHWWIKSRYGNANKCTNPNCLKESKCYEWALIKGKRYERNIENFMMMCRSCHHKYDTTEEFGRRMRKLNTGKIRSLETKQKMSDVAKKIGKGKWMLGRKIPQSVRDKISQNSKRVGSKIRNKNTNEVYKSLVEAALKNNIPYKRFQYLLAKKDISVSNLEYVNPPKYQSHETI